MKRDMDLVRQILMFAADKPTADLSDELHFGEYSEAMVLYHIKLLIDAQLLDGEPEGFIGGGYIYCRPRIGNLTWAGNEFVDAAKDPTVWQRAMTHVIKPAAGFTFSALLEYLKTQALQRLAGAPG